MQMIELMNSDLELPFFELFSNQTNYTSPSEKLTKS